MQNNGDGTSNVVLGVILTLVLGLVAYFFMNRSDMFTNDSGGGTTTVDVNTILPADTTTPPADTKTDTTSNGGGAAPAQ